jgi:hypothetical protein
MKKHLLTLCLLMGCGRSILPLPSQTTPHQQQPLGTCDGKSVILMQGRDVKRVSPDGSMQTVFTFGASQAEDTVWVSTWLRGEGFVAGAAHLGAATNNTSNWEYAVIRDDGTVTHTHRSVAASGMTIFLGNDGSLAGDGDTGWLVRADGTLVDLGTLQPMSALLPSGDLMVANGNSWEPSSPKGIWNNGVFSARAMNSTVYDVTRVGSHLVVVDGTNLHSVVDDTRIALPLENLYVLHTAGDHFVLLSNQQQLVKVDLLAGTATIISGVSNDFPIRVDLAVDGAVMKTTETGDSLQLFRSSNLGASWNSVGAPMVAGTDMGLGRWMHTQERGGSTLVSSVSTGYGDFINEVQLVTPNGSHSIDTGGVYVNTELENSTSISGDGACAVTWTRPEGSDYFGDANLIFFSADGTEHTVAGLTRGQVKLVP